MRRLLATICLGLLALLFACQPVTPTKPQTTSVRTAALTSAVWTPPASSSFNWQWQLDTPVDLSVNASMFDVDGFDNSASVIAGIHAKSAVAICYFSVGSWENWRPDAAQFPASVKGRNNGWPGEKWLDIRNWTVLGPIMAARFNLAVSKGCDGVEPDNVDGYTNSTGFPLTAADQIAYNTNIANLAHSKNLSVPLKNDVDQTAQLVPYFDFAINEQCNQYSECGTYAPFTTANKLVLNVEYKLATSNFCPKDRAKTISGMRKKLSLNAYREVCPG